MGFQANYIQRAFKVYEKNYGHSYNVEVITEIIVRLQNKDKQKGRTPKKEQSASPNKGKSPSKQPSSNKKSPSKKQSQSSKVPKHPQPSDAQQVHIQSSSNSSISKPRVGGMGGGGKGHHSPQQITVKTEPPPKAYSGSSYGGASNANANSPVPSTPPSNMKMDKIHRSSSGGGSARNSSRKQPRPSPNTQSDYNHSPYNGNARHGHHSQQQCVGPVPKPLRQQKCKSRRSVPSNNVEKFRCSECPFEHYSSGRVKGHFKKHRGKCHVECPFTFRGCTSPKKIQTWDSLRLHLRKCPHQRPGELTPAIMTAMLQSHRCPFCSKPTGTMKQFSAHCKVCKARKQ